ncbi:chorion class CA protein ERA.1-like [Vanessa atalanta]|uniref:chorion class CA protein ERA.1-like n=1 Tax=Vanessa atalanta TaxID=42275 RepID=UPI001FCCD51C|nr:chorion class CA protein ERA.1-like [Vanessa atalanta]
MSTFAFLLLCVQACLVQNAFSQCLYGGIGPGIAGPALAREAVLAGTALGLGVGLAPAAVAAYPAAYGGAGVGDVGVAGEMGVAGTTAVAGQVPILGAVEFGGVVPAAGTVAITGSCGCGCNGPYIL